MKKFYHIARAQCHPLFAFGDIDIVGLREFKSRGEANVLAIVIASAAADAFAAAWVV
jgi:hypothetical protein